MQLLISLLELWVYRSTKILKPGHFRAADCLGAGETKQQLGMFSIFTEDLYLFPSPKVNWLPYLGIRCPLLASEGTYTNMHVPSYTHAYD